MVLKLMGMVYEIQYKQGKEDMVVDALSRATHAEVLMLFVTRKGKIVVGSMLQSRTVILDWLHASPVGGHSDIRATEKRIKAMFYWKGDA